MIRHIWLAVMAGCIAGCNFSPAPLRVLNTVGGARINSFTQTPLANGATSLILHWDSSGQAGRLAIADVMSYGGSAPLITAPRGWNLIRDDASGTTRQSLYWRVIQSCDPDMQQWSFSVPVAAQGMMMVLDGFDAKRPIDVSGGAIGGGFTPVASSIKTRHDGDLILAFFATDFRGTAPGHDKPANLGLVVDLDQPGTTHEYWLLAAYQRSSGKTGDIRCKAAQVFSWAAAQVAIKRRERN